MMNEFCCQAVVFDMDGVLVDTSPSHAQAYALLWNRLSIQGPDYSTIAGRSTSNVIDEYAQHLSKKERQQAVSFKQSSALQFLENAEFEFNDTVSSLLKMKATHLPMVVATSASKASSSLVLNRLNVAHCFKAVITAEEVKNAKPAPDLFLKAIDYLGHGAQQVLIIEDSQSGIDAALASGAWVVSVRNANLQVNHSHYLGHFANLADMTQWLLAKMTVKQPL